MQVYLVVRSFAERDAYMYSSWYGRVANKAYQHDVSASQTDWERHFTVACYEDDPALSSQQVGAPLLQSAFSRPDSLYIMTRTGLYAQHLDTGSGI